MAEERKEDCTYAEVEERKEDCTYAEYGRHDDTMEAATPHRVKGAATPQHARLPDSMHAFPDSVCVQCASYRCLVISTTKVSGKKHIDTKVKSLML